MCQSKANGGKRCSAADRRTRRKKKKEAVFQAHQKEMEKTGVPTFGLIAPKEFFDEAVANGEITAVKDREFPEITVYNYTNDSHYAQNWNEITNVSRGLIVNTETGEILGRPFTKFFNNDDPNPHNDFPRTGRIEVMDKKDGSMGVLYPRPDGTMGVATRGSTNSEQAKHASRVYNERYAGQWNPNPDHTYMYEIIYPGNQIVLDYGDTDDIVMLGAIDKKTGASIEWDEINKSGWPGPVVEKYEYASFSDVVKDAKVGGDNREGFVVHFRDHDKRVKLKFEEYLKLHKTMFALTPLRVWESLEKGEDVKKWAADVPDEFYSDIDKTAKELRGKYDDHSKEAYKLHKEITDSLPAGYSRKDLAMKIKGYGKKHPMFSPGDMMSVVSSIEQGTQDVTFNKMFWKKIRPDGRDRF